MISNRLEAWIRDRKGCGYPAAGHTATAARSEPSPTSSPEWYAGLVVSPASFSRQLGDMQLSLMRANVGEPGEPNESGHHGPGTQGHTEIEAH